MCGTTYAVSANNIHFEFQSHTFDACSSQNSEAQTKRINHLARRQEIDTFKSSSSRNPKYWVWYI